MINFVFVIFLENIIKVGFSQGTVNQILKLHPDRHSFVYENAFIIFNLCYNLGKTITLSSLGCFKLEKVWTISVAIILIWTFYLLNYYFLWLENIEALWAIMFIVGICTGLMCVNVLYLIRKTEKLDSNQRELAFIIMYVSNNIGECIAALICLLFN